MTDHARLRFDERIGGDADVFVSELARALAEGRYRLAWRHGFGVYVDAAGIGSAFVNVSRVSPLAVTVYPDAATPRDTREGRGVRR